MCRRKTGEESLSRDAGDQVDEPPGEGEGAALKCCPRGRILRFWGMKDPDRTPQDPLLYTPEFAAKRRRSIFWSMIMCIAMGLALVIGALYAREHGGMLTSGPKDHFTKYPWWLVAPVGAGLAALGVWGLWRNVTGRE